MKAHLSPPEYLRLTGTGLSANIMTINTCRIYMRLIILWGSSAGLIVLDWCHSNTTHYFPNKIAHLSLALCERNPYTSDGNEDLSNYRYCLPKEGIPLLVTSCHVTPQLCCTKIKDIWRWYIWRELFSWMWWTENSLIQCCATEKFWCLLCYSPVQTLDNNIDNDTDDKIMFITKDI